MDNLNCISWIKVESNLEWLQTTTSIGGKMKLQTQFTVPKKDLRDIDYFIKMQTLEKTRKQSCIDYPSEEDCIVCCN